VSTLPRPRAIPPIPPGAVAEPASSLDFHTGSWRQQRPVHQQRPAPCHAACPAGEDPQAWLALLQEGNSRGAWESLIAANPLPAITGRVCPHPCEGRCNRGHYDAPVAIHAAERALGDAALAAAWPYPEPEVAAHPLAVAVVGAGPAGLSAAWQLWRRGHRPVVFDARPEIGGLLRSAIAPYRLPRALLDAELDRLGALSIDLRLRHSLGRDVSLDELESEFDAVILALGAGQPRSWEVDGALPADHRSALAWLEEWISTGSVAIPQRAIIHGGGNTAVDLARVLRHHGAEVDVVTASALPGVGPPGDRMAALPREVEQAQEEGVRFHPHAQVARLVLRGGRVRGAELASLRKLPGAGGHTRRVGFEGTESLLEADAMIPATGEVVDPRGLERLLKGEAFLRVDSDARVVGAHNLYAAGDACGACGMVAAAVGQGRRAAEAIHREALGRVGPAQVVPPIPYEALQLHYFDHHPRVEGRLLPPAERDLEREVEAGFEPAELAAEVSRCFSCGSCMSCDNCWTLCPDSAVLKAPEAGSDASPYVFDLAYCKGCGICAAECPTGFIAMQRESG